MGTSSFSPLRWFGGVVLALLLLGGIILGGWQAHWWFVSNGTNRQAHIFQQSYGTQSADMDRARDLISDIAAVQVQTESPSTPSSEIASLNAQETALTTQACGLIEDQTSPPSDEATFAASSC